MFKQKRHGLSLIYACIAMVAMTALASLAVDYGRVQMVKTQLRAAADAAARAAAHDIPFDLTLARQNAVAFARKNKADGKDVILDAGADIEFLNCKIDAVTKKPVFTVTSDIKKINAVHVTARRVASRGNAVPLALAGLIGRGACDVRGESIVMVVPAIVVNQNVPATANPFLSGMPRGAAASMNNPHNSPDYAGDGNSPRQAPQAVNMPVNSGDAYTFDSIDGNARHDPNLPYYSPDGELGDIGHNTNSNENGIADTTAPINALVGIFLNDNQPNQSSAPRDNLKFNTASSRDFVTLSPQLKQIFFIGDGLNSAGIKQEFIAPPGATRLFLATWDFFEWNNNAGWRNVRVNRPEKIITVK